MSVSEVTCFVSSGTLTFNSAYVWLRQCDTLRRRSVEAAAMLHKEAGNFSQAADLIEQASTMYLEHGTQDTAAVVLDRAGKWVAVTVCSVFLVTYQLLKTVDINVTNTDHRSSLAYAMVVCVSVWMFYNICLLWLNA